MSIEIKWKRLSYLYEVSNMGDVRNTRTGHILACTPCNSGYRTCVLHGVTHSVHRLVGELFISLVKDLWIDHISGDKLDNRVVNLRCSSSVQNPRCFQSLRGGSSVYRGVTKMGNKWVGRVGHKGKYVYCGSFDKEIEAAMARDRMASGLGYSDEGLNFPYIQGVKTNA